MANLNFRDAYKAACATHGVEPLSLANSLEGDKLVLSSSTLSERASLALGEALRHSAFATIEITHCYLHDAGCRALCQGLSGNMALRVLNLSGNNLGSSSGDVLGALVRTTPNLRSLVLEWNNIGAKAEMGLQALCDGLSASKAIESIDLRNNHITEKGAQCCACLLEASPTLTALDLRWNKDLGQRGAEVLAKGLVLNRSLTSLQLTGTGAEYTTLVAIGNRLQENTRARKEDEAVTLQTLRQREMQMAATESVERLQAELELRNMAVVNEKERCEDIQRQSDALEAEKARLLHEIELQKDEVERLKAELHGAQERHRSASTAMAAESEEAIRLLSSRNEGRVAELEGECEEKTQAIAALRQESKQLTEQLDVAKLEAERRGRRIEALEEQNQEYSRDTVALKTQVQELSFELKRAELSLKKRDEELDAMQAAHQLATAKRGEIEEKYLSLERQFNALDAQRLRDEAEHTRQIQALRDAVAAETRGSAERQERRVRDLQEDLRHRDAALADVKETMATMMKAHHTALDDVEAERKTTRDSYLKLEVEHQRLLAHITQTDGEKKRMENELRAAEERREVLTREIDNLAQLHQQDVDRLTEMFAADRLSLERRALQREERCLHLEAEVGELTKKVKRAADDAGREKERLQRRIAEQGDRAFARVWFVLDATVYCTGPRAPTTQTMGKLGSSVKLGEVTIATPAVPVPRSRGCQSRQLLPKLYKSGREWRAQKGQSGVLDRPRKTSKVSFPQLELKNAPRDGGAPPAVLLPAVSDEPHRTLGETPSYTSQGVDGVDSSVFADSQLYGPTGGLNYAEYDLVVLRQKALQKQKLEREERRTKKERKKKLAEEAAVQLMNDIDEFTLKHVSNRPRRQSEGGVAADVGQVGRNQAWSKFRGTHYADLWKRMGAPAVSNLYEAVTGGIHYKMSESMWKALHEELGEDDPGLMEELQRRHPHCLEEIYAALDADGNGSTSHTEFMSFMAGLFNSANTMRIVMTLYQHLNIDGKIFAPLQYDEVCDSVLPHVPKSNVAQTAWRDVLEQLVSVIECSTSTEAWSLDVFVKTLYLNSSRSLDSYFTGLTIRKKQDLS